MTIHEGMDCIITLAADVGVRRLIRRWLNHRAIWLIDIRCPSQWVMDCLDERSTWKKQPSRL